MSSTSGLSKKLGQSKELKIMKRINFATRLNEAMNLFSVDPINIAIYLKEPEERVWAYLRDSYLPSVSILCRIADYFDCSVDYLLGRSNVWKRS